MFISLFISVVIIANYCASARLHSDNKNSSQQLSPLSYHVSKNIAAELNKQQYEIFTETNFLPLNQEVNYYQNANNIKLNHKNSELHQNDIKHHEIITFFKSPSLKLLSDLSEKDKSWIRQVSDNRLRKRNINDKNVNKKPSISKRKQKKAKVLGRLLQKNVSSKKYEDIQDDYIEDEDDDYFKGVNRKKMKWENFRNEDGASVMELIALNARHKTNMHHASTNN